MGDFDRGIAQSENDMYEDEEEEEKQRGRHMLGILFGNVDDSGDLDEEYLDQDAKEHLSALAGQLGQSLVDIELSARKKDSGALSDVSEEQEDYGRKADDAVDYEDIQEQYEGPEVQIHCQDDQAISQDQQYYAEAALLAPSSNFVAFVPEEENYDEEEDYDKEAADAKSDEYGNGEDPGQEGKHEMEDGVLDLQGALQPGVVEGPVTSPLAAESPHGDVSEPDIFPVEVSDELETCIPVEDIDVQEVPSKFDLPVLYEEEGKEVLWFSELFGYQEPHWICKREKRHQKQFLSKGKHLIGPSEAAEEDEDVLLTSCSVRKDTFEKEQVSYEEAIDSEGTMDDKDFEFSDSSKNMLHSDDVDSHVKFWKRAQPMKEDGDNWQFVLERLKELPSPNLHAVHQEDWEAAIIWDGKHLPRVRKDPVDNANECSGVFENMDVDTREEDGFCLRERDEEEEEEGAFSRREREGPSRASLDSSMSEDTKNYMAYQSFRPVLTECIGSSPYSKGTQVQRTSRHPQFLRLENLPVMDKTLDNTRLDENIAGVGRRFQKLKLQNHELLSGSWANHIIWDDESITTARMQCSKVIFDLQDDQMVFEIPEGKNGQYLRAHAAAMVVTPHSRNCVAEAGEGHNVGFSSPVGFNISNDKYYMNRKNPQQQKLSAKKRSAHGIKVIHSLPAMKLQTMKPKLTNKDLANFHRPKAIWYPHHNEVAAKEQGELSVKGPMKVILKTMGGKGSKLYVDASEMLDAVKMKSTKKFGDLKGSERTKIYYSGKELEDGKTLAQQEVKPNSVLHLVRTKVHPWPRAQRVPGENKPTRPPGAFKKKSDLSVKDGHVVLAEYCEERPLLLGNVGMGVRLSTYYRKVSPTDSTAATLRNERGPAVGVPLPLEPTEDSPFLGEIRPGDTQTCLETNMYRAPAFHHKVAHTDFLLVRSAKGKLSLRRIDSIHVIGQQEPHVEVFTPSSKTVQSYINNRLLAYMYREFRNNEKPGCVPRVQADEVIAQFPSLSEGYLRKRLKHCADLQKGTAGDVWLMRPNFRIPSEEELRRMVNPENVCTYESMQAGLYHLKKMGINKLTQPSGLSAAMNQLADEAIVLAAASHIERELQITPWNLSCNFVAATIQGRGSLERLEITGAGDPSGRGLGFSYVRVAPKAPGSGALVEKKAAAARGGGAVTGTDADLRRLSMDAAREVLLKFNVPEGQIDKMTRWHRIALVRKLSSEQAASGVNVGAAALNKFARGQRMSFLQLQQQTREKCQEIWDRQVQSLSAICEDNSESHGEANEDLDSFAGDLENLLEAEEGETEEVASKRSKSEAIRGTCVRRKALETQREEDIEDEEAEAAELRRMLMEDDDPEDGKKRKKIVSIVKDKKDKEDPVKEQIKDAPDVVKVNGTKLKKKVIKRIIRTKKPDGTYTLEEVLITDPKEVAHYLAKKNAAENGKSGKEKKSSLPPEKKEKKSALMKDNKKPKKVTKGEAGGDGLQLVCGACKQVGHIRTNKKVCPLYTEDGKTSAPKVENIDPAEPSVRQGIKFTLKKAAGPPPDNEQQMGSVNAMVQKIPSIKIKFSSTGGVDVASGSSSKVATPIVQGRNISLNEDAPKQPEEQSAEFIKKIKVQKKHKKKKEGILHKKGDAVLRGSTILDHLQSSVEVKRLELLGTGHLRNCDLEGEDTRELELEIHSEDDYYQRQLEEERFRRKKEEEEIRKQKRRKRLKQESERRKAKRREEKRKKEEERLRIEMDRDFQRQAALQRQLELERQLEYERKQEAERLERRRELERQREMEMERVERQSALHRKREAQRLERQREAERQMEMERQRAEMERQRAMQEQEEKEREKQRREKEKQRLEERMQARRPSLRDRGSLEKERSIVSKRRASIEVGVSRRVSDYAQQSKRRKGGEVQLANILENVVDILRKKTEISYLFLKPVTKKEAHDYLDVIRYPMDLSTIREKTRNLVYKTQKEFRRDVWQIAENAHIYNDHRNPGIPPLADRLLELCDDLLVERNAEIMEAEASIEKNEIENLYAAPSHVLDRRRT